MANIESEHSDLYTVYTTDVASGSQSLTEPQFYDKIAAVHARGIPRIRQEVIDGFYGSFRTMAEYGTILAIVGGLAGMVFGPKIVRKVKGRLL